MAEFEITKEDILTAMKVGSEVGKIIENKLNNTQLMILIAASKLYLEKSALDRGISKEEFDAMFRYTHDILKRMYQ